MDLSLEKVGKMTSASLTKSKESSFRKLNIFVLVVFEIRGCCAIRNLRDYDLVAFRRACAKGLILIW